jgi:hypothetical protein
MRTVKELREFLEGKPDDAEVRIAYEEKDNTGESVVGFTYTHEHSEDGEYEIKAVVLSSWIYF